jgi:hypothetical protein
VSRNRSPSLPQPPQIVPGIAAELEDVRVVERPDGFWAQPLAGGPESGPYASLIEAIEDQRVSDEEEPQSAEALAEVEREIGVCDWIDPETSAPAEDSVPHLEEH